MEGPNARNRLRLLPDDAPGTAGGLAGPLDESGDIPLTQIPPSIATDAELSAHVDDATAAHAASAISYTAASGANWNDPDPTTAAAGLDALAGRVTALESAGASGVTSFNTRTGAVTLSKSDVTGTGLTYSDVGADASGAASAAQAAAIAASQPVDATLTALAGLNSTAGLVEQTGADSFTKRALGVGASTSVLTRADGDGRYDLSGSAASAQAASQPLDALLTSIAAQTTSSDKVQTYSGADTASLTTMASTNTANAIVVRDSSGNFSAGTITASLTGTASGNDVLGAAASALSSALSSLTSHTSDTTDAHAATAIGYTPTTSGHWSPTPSHAGSGLDQLASRVNTLEGAGAGVSSFNGRTGAVSPADGDYTQSLITGLKTSSSPSFVAVTSTASTGTAPLTVASTTKVTNLNADKVDGYDASQTAASSTIPVSSSSGNTIARGFIASGGGTGYVPIQQSDGSLAMGPQTVSTGGGLSGGTGVIVYQASPAPATLANNGSVVLSVGAITAPRAQVSIWEQGAARTNQTAVTTASTSTEASYTQESAASGTDFATTGIYLHRILSDSRIKFILQGNGSNGGAPFEPFFHTLGGSGFSVSTTTPKYGSGCVNIDAGTGIRVDTTGDVPSGWGAYSWTVEGWVRFDALTGFRGVFGSNDSSYNTAAPTAWLLATSGTSLNIYASSTNGSWTYANAVTAATVTTGTWYHIAVDYDATTDTMHVYVNGVVGATVTSVTSLYAGDKYLTLGYWNASAFDGQMDDVRITMDDPANAPIYGGSSFTPPGEFTDPSYTSTGYYVYQGDALALALGKVSTFDTCTFTSQAMTGTQLRYLVSWDGGTTWKDHSGSTVALGSIHTSGSTEAQMTTYFTGLTPPVGADTLRWAIGLKSTDATLSPRAYQISVQYDEAAPWIAGSPSSYEVRVWLGTVGAVEVKNVSGGSKTIYAYAELV